ncbi:MAG: PP0621 family protein [Pseudomonadota bacterium]
MTRILFWLALAFLVLMAIRSKLKGAGAAAARQRAAPPGHAHNPHNGAEAAAGAEAMLCCAQCGIYYPASESVRVDGLDYCSVAHSRLPAP